MGHRPPGFSKGDESMRRVVVGAMALSLMGAGVARAQDSNLAGLLAVIQEHFGQSMGEAVLGGQSVFVTARGSAKLAAAVARTYDITVEAQGSTAVEAAKLRDDKVDKLRAVAKHFSLTISLGEPSYAYRAAVVLPREVPPQTGGAGSLPPLPIPPVQSRTAPSSPPQMTARIPVKFSRPSASAMPAFMDALRDAGVDTLPDTNGVANPLAQLTELLGVGGAAAPIAGIDQEVWDRASAAAIQSAHAQAEALAAPAGRHIGAMRQVLLLSRSAQGDEATVTVAVRFGFEAAK